MFLLHRFGMTYGSGEGRTFFKYARHLKEERTGASDRGLPGVCKQLRGSVTLRAVLNSHEITIVVLFSSSH